MKHYFNILFASLLFSSVAVGSYVVANKSVTQIKLANRATGSTVAAGGIAKASSDGSVTAGSMTNMGSSVTITTTGRPVVIAINPAAPSTDPYIQLVCGSSGTGSSYQLQLARTGTSSSNIPIFMVQSLPNSTTLRYPPSIIYIDPVAAGTYTYQLQGLSSLGAAQNSVSTSNTSLVAYEM